jgi:cyclophilin family peptidyl-prolyl cis-trans isomerase/HEAT repeat protein
VKKFTGAFSVALALLGGCGFTSSQRSADENAALERILAVSDARPASADSLAPLLEGTSASSVEVRVQAVRALGRQERPDLVELILPLLDDPAPAVRAEAANALGQAVHGREPGSARSALLEHLADESDAEVLGVIAQTLGRLRIAQGVDPPPAATALAAALPPSGNAARLGFARGFYNLARQRAAFPPEVGDAVRAILAESDVRTRTAAAAALMISRLATAQDADRILADAHPLVRREAIAGVAVLADTALGSMILPRALEDTAALVRLETLRSLGRLGLVPADCAPIERAVTDIDTHVALQAIDMLATCSTTPARIAALDSLVLTLSADADGQWQRAAHALQSLAMLAPQRAITRMGPLASHASPFVRAWAARAAAAARDSETLQHLASDSVAIVRTAALQGLTATARAAAQWLALESLTHDDGELLMTAAAALEGTRDSEALAALMAALDRITALSRETSRDPRVALLVRIAELGSAADTARVAAYLRDFDSVIADSAAATIHAWTGTRPAPLPAPLPRAPVPSAAELDSLARTTITIEMANGGSIELRLLPWEAPTNAARFARLAAQGWFDGLTFHRVAPNFVVQGGSPGANEYAGDGPYTRDEVGIDGNWRGTMGLSTRGRDTGDGQIYINLIDNLRLDHDYTVFAVVTAGMDVVDRMQEGARIVRVVTR